MGIRTTLFALTYDRQMGRVDRAGLAVHRKELLTGATGRVLEIGSGPGINLPYYGSGVTSLTLTEPEPPMFRRLEKRAASHAAGTTALRAPAEDLPFEDDSFDVAVSTLVLCGVSDQPRALRELHRVLRPGGELLFIEHVRSDDTRLARRQDRMNGFNRFLVGCECNRSTLESIRAAGFDVERLDHSELPKAPPFARPLIIGTATAVPTPRLAGQQPDARAAGVS